VSLSLTGNAPVTGIGKANQSYNLTTQTAYEADGASHVYPFAYSIPNFDTFVKGNAATGAYPQIFANLSSVSAFTINALRLAFQTQKMLERDARGGTRYTEKIKAHFGVTSPDARLQRPEFLGGKSSNIQISTVPQTAPTSGASNNLGSLGAFALGTNTRDGFTKSFTEHGIIMGLLMVRADLTYQQGLDKKFTRSTQLDYYWPALAHIGEQAVLTKEIYCDGSATDAVVFGYQERYAEYRYGRNRISGLFRSTAASTLDVWHLAQKFASAPTLSDTFIKETMPVTRIEFVTTQPAFAVDCFNQVKAIRPMPVYSVPEKMDWF
jgi:hypothetical protein